MDFIFLPSILVVCGFSIYSTFEWNILFVATRATPFGIFWITIKQEDDEKRNTCRYKYKHSIQRLKKSETHTKHNYFTNLIT